MFKFELYDYMLLKNVKLYINYLQLVWGFIWYITCEYPSILKLEKALNEEFVYFYPNF